MYGTIMNGAFVSAPNPLTVNGLSVFNPSDTVYIAAGYLERVDTPEPEQVEGDDPVVYMAHYEEADAQAVRVWTVADPVEPVPDIPTLDERVTTLEAAQDDMILLMADMIGGDLV